MENFCKFITDPDWWSVIATIVAAFAAACITCKLGKKQNELQQQQLKIQERQNELQEQQLKLQEQQTKQQEYELYRRIYSQIFELDFFNKTILLRIVAILTSNEDKNLRLKLMDDIWSEYEKRSNEFTECTIDIELKQCGEGLDVKYYYDALQASRLIIIWIKQFIEADFFIFKPSLRNNIPTEHTIPLETFINIIMQLYVGRAPEHLKDLLLQYASIVEDTQKAQLLKVIKERITPTNTK